MSGAVPPPEPGAEPLATDGLGPDPDDVPIEELSVEPPPTTMRPPPPSGSATRLTPGAGVASMRPAPLLVRDAIAHTGRDAPAAPRSTSSPWGRISASGSPPASAPSPPRHPSSLPGPRSRPASGASPLPPRWIAIFGGLFGLATVSSVVALLIQVAPPRDERAMLTESSASTPEATAAPPAPPPVKKKERVAIPGPWRLSELAKDPSILVVAGVMERKSFITALEEKGVPRAQSYRIMKAFEGLRKFDKSGKKDAFAVAMDKATKKVRAFEYTVTPTEIYQAREGAGGLLAGARLDMKVAEEEVVSAFYVGKDLAASYRASGLEDGVLDAIDDALNGRLSSESFQEGAVVRLIATEETALGLFAKYKGMVAVEYRPPDPAEEPLRIYYFQGAEARGYFDERGKQPYKGGWRSPITGAPVTSRFNPKRMHPVLHKIMPHEGTDFGAAMGTPVYSAYRGVVASVGPSGPAGNLVTISHAGGVTTGYAHLSKFAPGIKPGDKIGTHQLVGYVGSTGRSTGPHLHFSAKKDGKFFDAETLQLDSERVLPPSERPAFLTLRAHLDARLDAIPLPEPPPEPVAAAPTTYASAPAPPEGSAAAASAAPPGEAPPSGQPAPPDPAATAGMGDDEGEDIVGPALGGGQPPSSTATPPP
jgi:murein DD-endopeptidase MepM/ murein hydrolase activator NlpD